MFDQNSALEGTDFEQSAKAQVNPAMLAAAKEEAAQIDDPEYYVHTFKRPFVWEDKTYDTLEFDFGKLTGVDMLAVENEIHGNGVLMVMPTFNGDFLLMLAARACGVGADVLAHVGARDFNRITTRTRSFLLLAES